jgi:hypothetical protein
MEWFQEIPARLVSEHARHSSSGTQRSTSNQLMEQASMIP